MNEESLEKLGRAAHRAYCQGAQRWLDLTVRERAQWIAAARAAVAAARNVYR